MEEKVIVKLIKHGKVEKECEYTNYDEASKYAKKKVEFEGYRAILLRLVNKRAWAKVTLYPPESC